MAAGLLPAPALPAADGPATPQSGVSPAASRLELLVFLVRGKAGVASRAAARRRGVDGRLAQRLLEPLGEGARRVVASRAEQLIARRLLDEDRGVAHRLGREGEQWHLKAQHIIELVIHA